MNVTRALAPPKEQHKRKRTQKKVTRALALQRRNERHKSTRTTYWRLQRRAVQTNECDGVIARPRRQLYVTDALSALRSAQVEL
jgi:hypothetical protein